jgi:small subunit ribosomal protein S20
LKLEIGNWKFEVILLDMPVTKQAIKKVRADRRKAIYNLKVKKTLKAAVSAFRKKPTKAGLVAVYRIVDRAAKTNVIHKNKASRLKSRLSRLISSKVKPPKSSTLAAGAAV